MQHTLLFSLSTRVRAAYNLAGTFRWYLLVLLLSSGAVQAQTAYLIGTNQTTCSGALSTTQVGPPGSTRTTKTW